MELNLSHSDSAKNAAQASGQLIVVNIPARKSVEFSRIDPALIAQLLAIRDNHPQWRNLRRNVPSVASVAYKKASLLNRS